MNAYSNNNLRLWFVTLGLSLLVSIQFCDARVLLTQTTAAGQTENGVGVAPSRMGAKREPSKFHFPKQHPAYQNPPDRKSQQPQPLLQSAPDLEADSRNSQTPTIPDQPFVILLGIAQDAGYPQAGCQKECCREAWLDVSRHRYAACLAIVDPISRQRFMIECTPDFKHQLRLLEDLTWVSPRRLDGILITHAHIGHYTGLIHLGREAMGETGLPVHVMPRMTQFLKTNGPWNQLVDLKNIELEPLAADKPVQLNERIQVTPILVPHRGEYSETVAFVVEMSGDQGSEAAGRSGKRLLFLPDIDRWEDWDRSIEELVRSVDYALLDGTFLADGELPGRDMSTIPHPTIEHSIARFVTLPLQDRQKIRFIHLNHTNPLLRSEAEHPVRDALKKSGMSIGQQGQVFQLGR